MFKYEITPHASVVIWGGYDHLRELHQLIHRILDQSQYINDDSGYPTWLAFEVRKAYDGHRLTGVRQAGNGDKQNVYGFETSWLLIILQVSCLRQAQASYPATDQDHVTLSELENVVKIAITVAMPEHSSMIKHYLKSPNPFINDSDKLTSRLDEYDALPADIKTSRLSDYLSEFQ
ncbi:DUF6904 family protein [Neptunomonas phycophila]|uniref:DUF6904 family protein n=1 Tax=Neptunomonas phycophila TaxID=1572645 RepID=UPI003513D86B